MPRCEIFQGNRPLWASKGHTISRALLARGGALARARAALELLAHESARGRGFSRYHKGYRLKVRQFFGASLSGGATARTSTQSAARGAALRHHGWHMRGMGMRSAAPVQAVGPAFSSKIGQPRPPKPQKFRLARRARGALRRLARWLHKFFRYRLKVLYLFGASLQGASSGG